MSMKHLAVSAAALGIVIGTVAGDIHDVGKKLVIVMLEGAGFEVIDLGINVPAQGFVDAIREHRPDVVGLSAFLTTTTLEFPRTIGLIRDAGLRDQVKILIGGAPVDQVMVEAVGAEADGNLVQHVTAAKLKLQGGSPVALNWAIDAVRKGGTVSVMGAYGPLFSAVKFGDAMNKGLTIRTNQAPVKRQWPRLLEHVRNGYLTPSDVVTHRFPLEHIAEAYHVMSAKLDGCIKPLVVPA